MKANDNSTENQLELIFEFSPDLIFIHDLKGNIVDMNKNLMKALNYKSKEDVLKLQIKDILNNDNKDFKLSNFLKLILNKSKRTEYYFRAKKGSYFPVEGFGFPYKMRNLDVIVNISSDIRDKKKLQKELLNTKSQLDNLMVKIPEIRLWALTQKKDIIYLLQKGGMVLKESEKKYREILESIKEGYFEVDLEGKLVFFNDSLCEILGYSPEELMGKNYKDYMDLDNINLVNSINLDEIEDKSIEFELIKKNGVKLHVDTTLSKKQDTTGELIGFYGLIRDVTKRKETEKKIKRKLKFERVVSKISSLFINPLNYDKAINASLEFMGKLSNASRSYLFLFNDINKTMDNTHEWCAKGITAEQENLQGLPQDMFPWWIAKLNTEETIHITDVLMMPEEAAAEHDILQQQNIKSLLVLPLFIGNILSGFIGFNNVRETGEWDEDDFFLLQISSEIIGNALKRRDIEKKLKDSEQSLINLNIELEQRIKLRTRELRESEEKYRSLINNIPDMIMEVDLSNTVIYVSPQIKRMLGYSVDNVIGMKISELIHSDDSSAIIKGMKTAIKSGDIFTTEYRLRHKDGYYIPVFARGSLARIGDSIKFIGVIRDITKRKIAEEKLKKSEEKYRLISESANDLIRVLDDRFEFEYINEKVHKRLLGYEKEDLIGQSHLPFFHPEDRRHAIRSTVRNLKRGHGSYQARFKDKNGNYKWFEFAGKIFYDSKGDKKVLSIARDINERKIAEQKLKESEEKYRKAYDQVNFYKDLFTHDISNILQTIKSSVELSVIYLKNPEKLNKIQEIWNLVNSQVNRGFRLVSNVRTLSQIEYTQMPIQMIEVFSILQEAIEYTKKGIQEKKINFQINSPLKTYNIKANELLLDVFENILLNAIKYNDNLVIKILIKISELQKSGIGFLKIEFRDNGIGISDKRKKIIFQKGYKKEKQSKGMGFGLTLVKKIIESYNGQIWAEDRIKGDYSKGSNIIILIPKE